MKTNLKFRHSLRGFIALLTGCLTVGSVWAYDFSAKSKGDVDIFYNINPDGKTVTVTFGAEPYASKGLTIPQEVSYDNTTYAVTAIGSRAFEKTAVRSIELPNTITAIQTHAFEGGKVEEINFPTALKTIGESAFYGTNIKDGVFPDGLEEIGSYAFYGTDINIISLPESLVTLGEGAFCRCDMETLRIPGNLKIIPGETFAECSNLTKVIIEEGVQSLGAKGANKESVFGGCPLTEIEIPSTLTYIGSGTFARNKFKEIVLPGTIKEIGSGCFINSSELESITFSSGMEEIPDNVCERSPKLMKVTIPEGIKKIGMTPFGGAKLLSHITFPESVTEVGTAVLGGTGIVDFTFPKNLTYIGSQMFESCDNLTEIIIPETITDIKNSAFAHCTNLRKVTFPSSLKSMDDHVFSYCSSLVDVNIPAGIGVLPESTFQDCSSLRKIVIPEGITKLGNRLFVGCSNLTDIELPKSLEYISANIIGQCDALRKLTIYHNVSVIEQHAFDGCKGIEEIHLHRAVVPKTPIPQGWLVDRPVIGDGNNCTLYVPVGSVDTYKASSYWNVFKEIVGEEVAESLNYQISFPVSISGGKLLVNGEEVKPVMEFAIGSDVEITAVPEAGYHLAALIVNGKNVTAEVTDGSYSIKNIDVNYTIEAEFAETPVRLSLFMAAGGSVDVEVEKNQTFSCFITPDEGWRINTVTFNDKDVIADLTDDNRYTTPAISADSELRVTFEITDSSITTVGCNTVAVKVYVDNTGLVTVEGVESGHVISAYSVNGMFIDTVTSTGGVDTLHLSQRGVYLIKTPTGTYKIHY